MSSRIDLQRMVTAYGKVARLEFQTLLFYCNLQKVMDPIQQFRDELYRSEDIRNGADYAILQVKELLLESYEKDVRRKPYDVQPDLHWQFLTYHAAIRLLFDVNKVIMESDLIKKQLRRKMVAHWGLPAWSALRVIADTGSIQDYIDHRMTYFQKEHSTILKDNPSVVSVARKWEKIAEDIEKGFKGAVEMYMEGSELKRGIAITNASEKRASEEDIYVGMKGILEKLRNNVAWQETPWDPEVDKAQEKALNAPLVETRNPNVTADVLITAIETHVARNNRQVVEKLRELDTFAFDVNTGSVGFSRNPMAS